VVQPDVKSNSLANALAQIRTTRRSRTRRADSVCDKAYEIVLANAGATLPKRDAVAQRVVGMVRAGKVAAKAALDIEADLSHVGYSKQANAESSG